MKYTYTGKGMEVTESLKARVEKKLGKFERYFRDEPEATVRFKQQKGARNIVEITVSTGGVIMRAEESSNDMYLSVDRAVDKLESQIRRYRTKMDKQLREAGLFQQLESMGIEDGDIVSLYDWEFEYQR